MNILTVYDSAYGNTAKIAETIGGSLGAFGRSRVLPVGAVEKKDLHRLDYLFIGSPTQGGRATEPIMSFISELPDEVIKSTKLAVFDTRFEATEQKKALRILMKVIGYAAPKMAAALRRKGGEVVPVPQGFIVHEKEGPLRDGEFEEASQWARDLVQASLT